MTFALSMRPAARRAARSLAFVAAASALLALAPASAGAQGARDPRLGASAGVASVERSGTGVYASGLVDYPLARRGRLVRMEGALAWWPVESDRDRSNHVWTFGAGLVQEIGRGAVQPFAVIGAAMYISDEREPLAGLNGGAGVRMRIGPSTIVAESRVHRRLAAIGGRMWVPLSLGVTF